MSDRPLILAVVVIAFAAAAASAAPPAKGPASVTGGTCLLQLSNGWHTELREGQVLSDDPEGIDPVLFGGVVDGTLPAFESLPAAGLVELWVPEGDLMLHAVSVEGTPHILDGVVCAGDVAPMQASFGAHSDASGPLVVTNRMPAPLTSIRFRSATGTVWGKSLLPKAGLAANEQAVFLSDEVPIAGSVLLDGSAGESWVFPYSLHTPMGAAVVADPFLVNAGPPCELELRNLAPVPIALMSLRGDHPLALTVATPITRGIPPGESGFTPIPPGAWEATWFAPGEVTKTGKELVASCPPGGAAVVTVEAGK